MNQKKMRIRSNADRLGATMVAVVIMLPVLFLLSAMVINLAHIQVVRTKTQIVTDSAARAAGRAYAETNDESSALAAAQQMASLNPIDNVVVNIGAGDLEFGLSQRNNKNKAYQFTPGANGNAVRVTTQSFSNGAGDAVPPLFPTFGVSLDLRPVCTATNTQSTLDVCLILDRSGSMAYAANESTNPAPPVPASAPAGWQFGDPAPPNSRWHDLVAAVDGFCAELNSTTKAEKVALVTYSNLATHDLDLNEDYTLISAHNAGITAAFQPGATNVGDGISKGVTAVTAPMYARPWANNALVLMSDGIHNTGTDPLVAADAAVAAEVPIFTVSFSNEADQVLMQQIADMTGGSHYHAVNAAQLNEAFRSIARRLPSILTE